MKMKPSDTQIPVGFAFSVLFLCAMILTSCGAGVFTAYSNLLGPANVTNLMATGSGGAITLTWTDPVDADFSNVSIQYSGIYNKTTSSGKLSVAKGVQTATISGLYSGTTYTITVYSVDSDGFESSGAISVCTP
jgi:hypothetical protein